MKIITCASYYGTGSSAVTDLINECDNVHFLGDYEFRFVQDPDGICDLEYNLVLNNHRHNSGYALKRYEKNVKFLNGNWFVKKYNKFFGDEWMRLSSEYVKKLVATEYKGYWHQDVRDAGMVPYIIDRLYIKLMHSIPGVNKERNFTLFMNNMTNYATYPGESFYSITKEYIDDLFTLVNTDNKEFVMVDQLVPPSNTSHYLSFFSDIKVICVDRDPRDLYILEREYWNGTIIPHDVNQFCIWFRATRAHKSREVDNDQILRISFEDLIYHYTHFKDKILDFCGIAASHHVNPRTRLIPEESCRNTKLFEKHHKYDKEIRIIETELSEYLYDYENGKVK